MSKVTFDTGNFTLLITGTLSDDQREKADNAAIRWITQRDVASHVFVQLGGVENSKGKLALPDGFERTDVEYNADNAEAMKKVATAKLNEYGSFQVEVSERQWAEDVQPRAMATQMWNNKVKDNPVLREQLGIAADATDEVGIEACHNLLASFRKSKKS